MEEAEYNDNEKVLLKAKVKLSIPHQKPEEANCFLTEDHVIIDAKEVIKIPLYRILNYDQSLGSIPYGIGTSYGPNAATKTYPIYATLTFFDELYKKQRLSFEADSKDLFDFKITIDEQTRVEKAKSLVNEEVLVVLSSAKKALCFTSNWVIITNIVGFGGIGYALGGLAGGIAEAVVRGKEIKGISERSPENILLADKENFAIPYTAISKVELSKKMLGLKIRITTAAAKYEFGLEKPKEFEKTVNNLRSILTDKLAW